MSYYDGDEGGGEGKPSTSSSNIVLLLDSFLEQVNQIRKALQKVSISALILAPVSIALSMYILSHPLFFDINLEMALIEIDHEFGIILLILLSTVIIVSSIWIVTGIRQYRSMNSWNKRYNEYLDVKEEMDKRIASQYGLNEQHDSL
jgi:hypothetical protein